jgi:hypothetical protein
MSGSGMSPLSSLPDEVIKLVMQHVPLSQRLTTCCLVNKRVHAAAVAATDALDVLCVEGQEKKVLADQIRLKPFDSVSLLLWLSTCGQHVTSIRLRGFPETVMELPCRDLQYLRLDGGSIQLGAANGHPGVIEGCSKLTQLNLTCAITDACQRAVIDSLSCLVDLQHLYVQPTLMPFEDPDDEWNCYSVGGLSGATLPRLKHLTCLRVSALSMDNMLQLSALTGLQSLKLMTGGTANVPGLVFPASLKTLFLFSKAEAGVLSLVPTGLQELWIECDVEGPSEGPSSLLSLLARFQHLTELVVQPPGPTNWPPAGPAFSALTASTNLVSLYLNDCHLPRGMWPFVFPPSHPLPHHTGMGFYANIEPRGLAPHSAWDAADVSALVRCCPNLREIPCIGLQLGPHVSELHKLTALTRMQVVYGGGSSEAVRESLKGLGTVTQLQSLTLSAEFRVGDLLPLTNLTALTSQDHTSCHPGGGYYEPKKSALRAQVELQACP